MNSSTGEPLVDASGGDPDYSAGGDLPIGGPGNTTSDATISFQVGTDQWIEGIDESDTANTRPFKIARGSALGTNDRFELSDAGLVTLSAYPKPLSLNGTAHLTVEDSTGLLGIDAVSYETRSTGLLAGGVITINGGDTAEYDISDGNGEVVSITGVVTQVTWTGLVAASVGAYVGILTYISIDSTGTVQHSTTPPTNTDIRNEIFLGFILHLDTINIDTVNNLPMTTAHGTNQLRDLMEAIGFINVSGNVLSASSTDGTFNKTSGEAMRFGANKHIDPDNPHLRTIAALDTNAGGVFSYSMQNDTSSTPLTQKIFNILDNNTNYPGTTYGNNQWGSHRVWTFLNGGIIITPAQTSYSSAVGAVTGIGSEIYTVAPEILDTGILIGYIVTRGAGTDLSLLADAEFHHAGKFGTASGSIGSSTNGNVVGPASAIDNTICRYDSTTGKIIQGTGVTITDSNAMLGGTTLNLSSYIIAGGCNSNTGRYSRSLPGSVAVGELNATAVALAAPGITTTVRGPLVADEGVTVDGTALEPVSTAATNLGASGKRWLTSYVVDVNATGSITVGTDLLSDGLDTQTATQLSLGGVTAAAVKISKLGAQTDVAGNLVVAQGLDVTGNIEADTYTEAGVSALLVRTPASSSLSTFCGENCAPSATGTQNTGFGNEVLNDLSTGLNNTCMGGGSGEKISTASNNANYGVNSGNLIVGGDQNTCIGTNAGNAITSGSSNTCIGFNSDCTAALDNSTAIGQGARATASNNMVLGNSSVIKVTSDSNGVCAFGSFSKRWGLAYFDKVVATTEIEAATVETPELIVPLKTVGPTSTGTVGQMAHDAFYIYTCVATNTWERVATATWTFSPSAISGLQAQYDASNTSSMAAGPADATVWNDLTANSHHLSTVLGTPRTGDSTQNGLNVVDLVAGENFFNSGSLINYDNHTIVIVSKITSVSVGSLDDMFGTGSSTADGHVRFGKFLTGGLQKFNYKNVRGASANNDITTWEIDEGWHIIVLHTTNTLMTTIRDGDTTDTFVPSGTLSGLSRGVGLFTGDGTARSTAGQIAEVLVYDEALSDNDMNNLGQHLATKWGLSWADI